MQFDSAEDYGKWGLIMHLKRLNFLVVDHSAQGECLDQLFGQMDQKKLRSQNLQTALWVANFDGGAVL